MLLRAAAFFGQSLRCWSHMSNVACKVLERPERINETCGRLLKPLKRRKIHTHLQKMTFGVVLLSVTS